MSQKRDYGLLSLCILMPCGMTAKSWLAHLSVGCFAAQWITALFYCRKTVGYV
ncbi:hypothetical protein NXG27_13110 [Megasphaera paucivorans]|uniref:hypothetical protein n=1 Tax=Megasphaera paucivorans TaxID=349095 RepID=UPI0015A25B08|nr:hypothetical protein [Megasphaera paucivorans]